MKLVLKYLIYVYIIIIHTFMNAFHVVRPSANVNMMEWGVEIWIWFM